MSLSLVSEEFSRVETDTETAMRAQILEVPLRPTGQKNPANSAQMDLKYTPDSFVYYILIYSMQAKLSK